MLRRAVLPAEHRPGVTEMDVLWLTAGLGCDGETISITAATQPALEELMFGALPWAPSIKLHNPVLAYETGDDFLAPFHRAAEGKLSPFILVVEGSIPNERNKQEGYWASFGTDRADRPAHPHLRLDRPAGPPCLGGCGRRNVRHLRRHSRHAGQPDRRHGSAGLSRLAVEIERRNPHRVHSRLSRPARQHDRDPALPAAPVGRTRAHDSARRGSPAHLAFRRDGA